MQFKDLDIIPEILKALENEKYISPTPIQEQAITPLLKGRDLLGCAQTGTGKTAAFAIPIIQLLSNEIEPINQHRVIKSLILTPTRELAIQIFESFRTYGQFTNLRYGVIFGGVSQKPQEQVLSYGIDILIATPGRLNDLLNQNLVDLKNVKIFVLDEADHMLDMGFIHDVKKITAKIPQKKQTLLFSATMPSEILKMADSVLVNPVKITVTPVSSTVDLIQQKLYFVDKKNKQSLLQHILNSQVITSALVFTRTKHGADRVVKELMRENISAAAIHGNKSQTARQTALEDFKSRKTRVLVATDIAARGIDIDELSHVINFELPNISETYVHRIGRTGRAGFGGVAISFCDINEEPFLKDIQALLGKKIPVVEENPYPMMIFTPEPKAIVSFNRTLAAVPTAKSKSSRVTNVQKVKEKRNQRDFYRNDGDERTSRKNKSRKNKF
ncbi:MAG: DEAD/DEAH box helicase [Clostridiales bacterium GWF2_36_10]|nr:MAG: DEAD/DEAH box helicase [Clostridiales bacterium GWF2_36_10]HAN21986.1 DEAD/DEAH box helicase [Clostridiales bacterium]